MKHPPPRTTGFTLIELLIAISIIAILLMLAAPNLIDFHRSSQLSSSVNTFVSAMNAARGEAMKRNMPALVIPNGDSWSSGFIAFVDADRDGRLDASKDIVILKSDASAPYITVSGNNTAVETPAYIRFDGSGFARNKDNGSVTNLTLNFTRDDVPTAVASRQTRRLKIIASGRARVCTPTSATDAACAASGG